MMKKIPSLCLACLLSGQYLPGLVAQELSMPDPSYLTWPDGPPNLHPTEMGGGSYASAQTAQRYLSVHTGTYSLEVDVRDARITRFGYNDSSKDQISAPGRLHLIRDGKALPVRGNHQVRYDPEFFPVRIVECGQWFQHFAIHDLVFADADDVANEGDFWMEILAWPERMRVLLRTTDEGLALRFAGKSAKSEFILTGYPEFRQIPTIAEQVLDGVTVYTFAALEWSMTDPHSQDCVVNSSDKDVTIITDKVEGIQHVILGRMDVAGSGGTELGTPMDLGASAEYTVRLSNPSSQPARLDLMIGLPENIRIVGHCLMLLDGEGNQTGIPIQISKNWHRKELDQFLPYMGGWSHGRVSLVLPSCFEQEYTIKVIQGDYGDYNSSSIAQLSLIGWGGNGIWIQSALGSWGETVCLQPGRVLRRTMVTDWRPFKTYSMKGKQYDWTANAGGADVFVYYDTDGNYIPFVDNRHILKSHGPGLAQMDFSEISRDRKLRVSGSWLLPQTNDVARVYLKMRCDVLEDLEFSRLSFVQLGADRYNANLSSMGAAGNIRALLQEISFDGKNHNDGYFSGRIALGGSLPWITLYGDATEPTSRLGQAQRLMIVHEWKSILAGSVHNEPVVAFFAHKFQGKNNFAADLVAAEGVSKLHKGDFVEATLEFTLAPLGKDAYYGNSEPLKQLLTDSSNDWKLAKEIAARHNPVLAVGDGRLIAGPLPVIEFEQSLHHQLQLTGTNSLVPLTIRSVTLPGCWTAIDASNQETHQLNQEWRKNRDGTWDVIVLLDPCKLPVIFNLRLDS